jgi:hypothetical protein
MQSELVTLGPARPSRKFEHRGHESDCAGERQGYRDSECGLIDGQLRLYGKTQKLWRVKIVHEPYIMPNCDRPNIPEKIKANPR